MTDTPQTNFSLSEKLQAVYQLFAGFDRDLVKMHQMLPVHDDAMRAIFASVSRLTAFSDQVQLIFSLMREEIRVIDELTSDAATAAWTGQIEPCFYDWLRCSRAGATKVH